MSGICGFTAGPGKVLPEKELVLKAMADVMQHRGSGAVSYTHLDVYKRQALGHPLGCTGSKLTATLLNELARRNGRYGVVSMCIGGGMGAAGLFERV